jgi:predicted secreted protein
MVRFDESAHGRQANFHVGDLFEICLAETRTTGFKWVVERGGEPECARVSESADTPAGPPGRSGTHVWQFRAAQVGTATIVLHSRRAWETGTAPGRVFQIQVIVTE